MKLIDKSLLDSLTEQARVSPRHRAHFNLHPELNDPVQRLCIAMEPETYVRPHRHAEPETWEVLMILRGSLALLLFDDKGTVLERIVLVSGGPITAVELPQNTWHAPVPLESGTIVFEVKQGPYRPITGGLGASWSPAEGSSEAAHFRDWYRNAEAGAVPLG